MFLLSRSRCIIYIADFNAEEIITARIGLQITQGDGACGQCRRKRVVRIYKSGACREKTPGSIGRIRGIEPQNHFTDFHHIEGGHAVADIGIAGNNFPRRIEWLQTYDVFRHQHQVETRYPVVVERIAHGGDGEIAAGAQVGERKIAGSIGLCSCGAAAAELYGHIGHRLSPVRLHVSTHSESSGRRRDIPSLRHGIRICRVEPVAQSCIGSSALPPRQVETSPVSILHGTIGRSGIAAMQLPYDLFVLVKQRTTRRPWLEIALIGHDQPVGIDRAGAELSAPVDGLVENDRRLQIDRYFLDVAYRMMNKGGGGSGGIAHPRPAVEIHVVIGGQTGHAQEHKIESHSRRFALTTQHRFFHGFCGGVITISRFIAEIEAPHREIGVGTDELAVIGAEHIRFRRAGSISDGSAAAPAQAVAEHHEDAHNTTFFGLPVGALRAVYIEVARHLLCNTCHAGHLGIHHRIAVIGVVDAMDV